MLIAQPSESSYLITLQSSLVFYRVTNHEKWPPLFRHAPVSPSHRLTSTHRTWYRMLQQLKWYTGARSSENASYAVLRKLPLCRHKRAPRRSTDDGRVARQPSCFFYGVCTTCVHKSFVHKGSLRDSIQKNQPQTKQTSRWSNTPQCQTGLLEGDTAADRPRTATWVWSQAKKKNWHQEIKRILLFRDHKGNAWKNKTMNFV